jgi:hypothetical protein
MCPRKARNANEQYLARALGGTIDAADPLMHWNRWFAELPPAGDYGTQKLFVFRKNGA